MLALDVLYTIYIILFIYIIYYHITHYIYVIRYGSHYMKKNFVACKTATTYSEDLSLGGGVVLYVQVF